MLLVKAASKRKSGAIEAELIDCHLLTFELVLFMAAATLTR